MVRSIPDGCACREVIRPDILTHDRSVQVRNAVARILCITYDPLLLATRAHTLKGAGHSVRCVASLSSALRECAAGKDDLLLLGHRIPKIDKIKIIDCFRMYNPTAQVAAFVRAGEHRIPQVDRYIYPGDPDELAHSINHLFAPPAKPAVKRRAAKKGHK